MGGQKLTQGWLSTTIEIGLAAARLSSHDCAIFKIEPGAFECLQKLKELDLSGNKLRSCPPIQDLINLESLELG